MKYSYALLLILNTTSITQTSIGAELPEGSTKGPPIRIRVRPKVIIDRISMESYASAEPSTTRFQMKRSSALSVTSGSTLESIESQAAAATSVEPAEERIPQVPETRAYGIERSTDVADTIVDARRRPGHAAVAPEPDVDDALEDQRPTIRQRISLFFRRTFTPANILRILVNGTILLLNHLVF